MYKKSIVSGIVLTLALSAAAVSAGAKAPESLQFAAEAQIIPGVGETWDAGSTLEISGGDEDSEILYSSYDESVATVSEDGTVTGTGSGVTTIVAAAAEDETVSTSVDVAVLELAGAYSDTKHIDAMGCDITVELTLEEDGTFGFYRAPMTVQLEGGGDMPEMTDEGTYELDGAEIAFHAEELGDFTVSLTISDGTVCLAGKIPTGGAPTELELEKQETEEETEDETGEGTEEETGEETEEETQEETGK